MCVCDIFSLVDMRPLSLNQLNLLRCENLLTQGQGLGCSRPGGLCSCRVATNLIFLKIDQNEIYELGESKII